MGRWGNPLSAEVKKITFSGGLWEKRPFSDTPILLRGTCVTKIRISQQTSLSLHLSACASETRGFRASRGGFNIKHRTALQAHPRSFKQHQQSLASPLSMLARNPGTPQASTLAHRLAVIHPDIRMRWPQGWKCRPVETAAQWIAPQHAPHTRPTVYRKPPARPVGSWRGHLGRAKSRAETPTSYNPHSRHSRFDPQLLAHTCSLFIFPCSGSRFTLHEGKPILSQNFSTVNTFHQIRVATTTNEPPRGGFW